LQSACHRRVVQVEKFRVRNPGRNKTQTQSSG
jgi:hypothetical protein